MSISDLTPAWPVLFLLIGTVLTWSLGWVKHPRLHAVLGWLSLAASLWSLFRMQEQLPLTGTLMAWRIGPVVDEFGFQVDTLAWGGALAVVSLSLLVMTQALVRPATTRSEEYAALLGLTTTSLLLLASGNSLALGMAVILFAAVLALAQAILGRGEGLGLPAARTVLLGGVAGVLMEVSKFASMQVGEWVVDERVRGLVGVLAAILVLRPWPLGANGKSANQRIGESANRRVSESANPLAAGPLLMPLLMGAYLLVRLGGARNWPWPLEWKWATLGGVAFLLAALWAWGQEGRERALIGLAVAQATFLALLAGVGGGAEFVVTAAVSAVLGIGGLWVTNGRRGEGANSESANQRVSESASQRVGEWASGEWVNGLKGMMGQAWFWRWVAQGVLLLSLAGVPLTLGFVGRWRLYQLLLLQGGGWLPLLVVLGEVFVCAVLVRVASEELGVRSSELRVRSGGRQWGDMVALGAVAVVMAVLGLVPPLAGKAFGFAEGTMPSLGWLLKGTTLTMGAMLLLPPVAGYGLQQYFVMGTVPDLRHWVARALGLEWLYSALGQVLDFPRRLMRAGGDIVEGEGYLGWVVILIVLALIFFQWR